MRVKKFKYRMMCARCGKKKAVAFFTVNGVLYRLCQPCMDTMVRLALRAAGAEIQ